MTTPDKPTPVPPAQKLQDDLREKEDVNAGSAPKTELPQRLFDLVRHCRSWLHDDHLITDEEYAEIAAWGSQSARRLEDYDSMRQEQERLMLRSVFAMSIMEDDEELWREAYEKSDKCPMLAAAFELRKRVLDETDSAPYWLCYAMAESQYIQNLDCERYEDSECSQTADCITEWCLVCAAKAWYREQGQSPSVGADSGSHAPGVSSLTPAPPSASPEPSDTERLKNLRPAIPAQKEFLGDLREFLIELQAHCSFIQWNFGEQQADPINKFWRARIPEWCDILSPVDAGAQKARRLEIAFTIARKLAGNELHKEAVIRAAVEEAFEEDRAQREQMALTGETDAEFNETTLQIRDGTLKLDTSWIE